MADFEPLSVSLPTGPKSFNGPAELEVFIREEQQRWEWLSRAGELQDARSNWFGATNQILDAIEPWRRRTHNPTEAIQVLKNLIEEVYGEKKRTLISEGHEAKFIADVRSEYGDETASAVAFALVHTRPSDAIKPIRRGIGYAVAMLYRTGFDTKNRAEAFDDLVRRCAAHYDLLEQAGKSQKAEHGKLISDHAKALSDLLKEQSDKYKIWRDEKSQEDAEHTQEFFALANAKVSDVEARLATLEKRYEEIMRLKVPADYWDDERKSHRCATFLYGLAAAAGGAFGVWRLYLAASTASDELLKLPDVDGWKFLAGKLPLLLLAATLFWGLKILVRSFSAHQRLWMDAAERVALTKTYLAIHAQNQNLTDDDRTIILTQLLRPAAATINVDDAAPNITIRS